MHEVENLITADTEGLVFVCGVGRSGTSLVQSMLAAHPQVAVLPETGFLRRYVISQRLKKDYRRGGIPSVRERINADGRFENLGISTEEIVVALEKDRREFTDLAFYRRVLTLYGLRHGKRIVVDKDPRLVEFLPFVHHCFPQAHILHVVRDPRDVLVSKQKAAWSKGRSWWNHTFANRVQFEMGSRQGPKYFGDRYQVVVYEELLARPEETLMRICKQLELDFTPMMLDYTAAAQQLVRRDEIDWKRETMGPLLRHNSGKWHDGLTTFQTAVVERLCGNTMRFGDYEWSDSYSRLPLRQRIMAAAAGAVVPGLAKLYVAYRGWTIVRST